MNRIPPPPTGAGHPTFTVRDRQGEAVTVGAYYAGPGTGLVVIGDLSRVHVLDVEAAQRLVVRLLMTIAHAQGEDGNA